MLPFLATIYIRSSTDLHGRTRILIQDAWAVIWLQLIMKKKINFSTLIWPYQGTKMERQTTGFG